MGYEIKLIIGVDGMTCNEHERLDPVFEDGELYQPYKTGEDGERIKTGRKETYFMKYAQIDLCKCGWDSQISKLDWKNTDESHYWYYYGSDGNTRIIEDCYGDKSKSVPISEVIEALKVDCQNSEYRRFRWALALLESMQDEKEEIKVMFYGH